MAEIYYLILNKENLVVHEVRTMEEAETYVNARPYLRYERYEI